MWRLLRSLQAGVSALQSADVRRSVILSRHAGAVENGFEDRQEVGHVDQRPLQVRSELSAKA